MKNIKVKRYENQFINGKTKFVQNAQQVKRFWSMNNRFHKNKWNSNITIN